MPINLYVEQVNCACRWTTGLRSFWIMLHALAKSPDGKTASFRNSGGRGLVQLKCETPEKVPHQIQCRMWAGCSSSCVVLIHDFSASTMCRMEEIDFGGAGDLELLANTLCIELLPCCPLSVVNVTEMRTHSLSPGRSSNESTRKRPKAEGTKSSTLVSYKTQPCRFFRSKKGCSKGDLCTYAHEDIPSTCVQTQASQFYKTRLCSVFTKVGKCSLGDSCTFAHGSEELLQRGSHKLDDASQNVDLGRFQRCSVNCTTTLNLGEDGTPATTMPQSLTQHTLTWPLASGQNRGGPWACGTFGLGIPSSPLRTGHLVQIEQHAVSILPWNVLQVSVAQLLQKGPMKVCLDSLDDPGNVLACK